MASSGIKLETVLILGAVAGGLYLAYKTFAGVKAAAGAVADAGVAVYHGAQTLASPVSNMIALAFSPGPSTMGVPGNVIFPNGTAAPLSSYKLLTLSADPMGNVYIKDQGSTWQLGQSDQDGDWPATYVSG